MNNDAEVIGKFKYLLNIIMNVYSLDFLLFIVQTVNAQICYNLRKDSGLSKLAITKLLSVYIQAIASQYPYLHKHIWHHNCY